MEIIGLEVGGGGQVERSYPWFILDLCLDADADAVNMHCGRRTAHQDIGVRTGCRSLE